MPNPEHAAVQSEREDAERLVALASPEHENSPLFRRIAARLRASREQASARNDLAGRPQGQGETNGTEHRLERLAQGLQSLQHTYVLPALTEEEVSLVSEIVDVLRRSRYVFVARTEFYEHIGIAGVFDTPDAAMSALERLAHPRKKDPSLPWEERVGGVSWDAVPKTGMYSEHHMIVERYEVQRGDS